MITDTWIGLNIGYDVCVVCKYQIQTTLRYWSGNLGNQLCESNITQYFQGSVMRSFSFTVGFGRDRLPIYVRQVEIATENYVIRLFLWVFVRPDFIDTLLEIFMWIYTSAIPSKNPMDNCMLMKPIVETEIIQIINKFKQNKSAGHDDIVNIIIKKVAKEIALPLTIIFNELFSAGIVPENLKIAKVIPIYKKDDAEEFSNYRPVSTLPCFSKILERLVFNRCIQYIILTTFYK